MEWQPLTLQNQEYYKVKDDCCAKQILIEGNESAAELCGILWEGAPFAGEVVLSKEQRELIIQKGREIIRNMADHSIHNPGFHNQDILVIALIFAAQDFDDNEDETQMWRYLAKQLGFDSDDVFAVVCNDLRSIIRNTMRRNHRYLAEDGHIYYNTLFIHALAPSWTVFHLFNIVYSFYKKNLGCQYIEKDNSYSIFVSNIAARWEMESNTDTNLKLKSDAISSSFRQLFSYRKNLMTAVCERLVYKIDELLSGSEDILDQENRWDLLLKKWYDDKDEAEKAEMLFAKQQAGKTRIITNRSRIKPVFKYDNENVFINVPRIRLPEITNNTYIEIYQDGKRISKSRLPVMGDELCWTTSDYQYRITGEETDFNNPLYFRIVITCENNLIYDSEKSLYRNYLFFNNKGTEIKKVTKESGYIYLFTDYQSDIIIDDEPESYYSSCYYGYLFHLCAETAKHIYVNGADVLSESDSQKKIRCSFSDRHLDSIKVIFGNTDYSIFSKPVDLQVLLENESDTDCFFIEINGEKRSMSNYGFSNGSVNISLPWKSSKPNTVKVVNSENGKTVFKSNYCVIQGFSFSFDKPYYSTLQSDGVASFNILGKGCLKYFSAEDCEYKALIEVEGFLFELEIPKLSVSFGDMDAFKLPGKIWNKDVDKATYMHVSSPKGVKVQIALGNNPVPSNGLGTRYEIGNYIQSDSFKARDAMALCAVINSDGKKELHPITTIDMKARFTEAPLSIENKKIIWNPEGKYVGKPSEKFTVTVFNDKVSEKYKLSDEKEEIELNSTFSDGFYEYTIVSSGGLFSKGEELYKGRITIGKPEEFLYNGKKLIIKSVRFWDMKSAEDSTKKLKEAVYIREVEHKGKSIPDIPNPFEMDEYSGILLRITQNGEEEKYSEIPCADFNAVNPVRFWLIDKKRLVLKDSVGEDVFLNTELSESINAVSIANSESELSENGINNSVPEYFTFIIEEEN